MAEPFDERLVDHIRNGRNNKAKTMLNKKLARAFVDWAEYTTLLHYAVEHNNVEIAQKLIELGADFDRFGDWCPTPLRTAVMLNDPAAVVQVLLEANARLDIVDHDGYSALQLALDWFSVDSEVFKLFTCKLRTLASSNADLAELLISAGCNMRHAASLRDVNLIECLLQRGIAVNSKGTDGKTALHVAAAQADVCMADWLLKKVINVNTLNDEAHTALIKALYKGNTAMVQLLLEHGACPDGRRGANDNTPLYGTFFRVGKEPDELVACAELLLQHRASISNCENLRRIFYFALKNSCDEAVKLLIAHMAMLEMLGEPVEKSVMKSVNHRYRTKMSELRKYYEPCQLILTIKVFENWSLLDLLNESYRKMRVLVHKETFLQEVEKICSQHKLSELYPYYYNSIMRRIEKASQVVELENEAILVICKIYKTNYNQIYDFARGVVEYLSERDVVRLIQV